MAEIHVEPRTPYGDGPVAPAEPRASNLSWRAAFAGIAVALGVQILLIVLGLAVGASAMRASGGAINARSAHAAGLWYLASAVISCYVGGIIAGVTTRSLTRGGGAIMGLLVWAGVVLSTGWLLSREVTAVFTVVTSPSPAVSSEPVPAMQHGSEGIPAAQRWSVPDTSTPSPIPDLRGQRPPLIPGALAWYLFATLALSALAATLGGIVGAGSETRRARRARRRRFVSPPPPAHEATTIVPPPMPPGHVHP